MFKSMIAATLLAGVAVPAAATNYDAFTSFNGTQGAGGFSYGSFDGTNFTAFTGDTGCSNKISNVVCLGDLPGAFASTTGAHQSGTVIVPGDALILHPGNAANQDSAVLFTTPTAGVYSIDFSSFVADNNPSGVNITFFALGLGGTTLTTLDAAHPTFSWSTTSPVLAAGTQFGFAVNYDGVYYNDSTGINFTVHGPDASGAVPEPASWAMMVGGFGLVGGAMRRRSGKLAAA
jgi:hypothetical protein